MKHMKYNTTNSTYALLSCSMPWSLYDRNVANGSYNVSANKFLAVFWKSCKKFQMIIAQS